MFIYNTDTMFVLLYLLKIQETHSATGDTFCRVLLQVLAHLQSLAQSLRSCVYSVPQTDLSNLCSVVLGWKYVTNIGSCHQVSGLQKALEGGRKAGGGEGDMLLPVSLVQEQRLIQPLFHTPGLAHGS